MRFFVQLGGGRGLSTYIFCKKRLNRRQAEKMSFHQRLKKLSESTALSLRFIHMAQSSSFSRQFAATRPDLSCSRCWGSPSSSHPDAQVQVSRDAVYHGDNDGKQLAHDSFCTTSAHLICNLGIKLSDVVMGAVGAAGAASVLLQTKRVSLGTSL